MLLKPFEIVDITHTEMKLSRFLQLITTIKNALASVNKDGQTSIISETICTDVSYARHTFLTTDEGDWAKYIDEETEPVTFHGWTSPEWQLPDVCTRVCHDDARCVAANIKKRFTLGDYYYYGDYYFYSKTEFYCDLFDKKCSNLEPSCPKLNRGCALWDHLAFETTEQVESTKMYISCDDETC